MNFFNIWPPRDSCKVDLDVGSIYTPGGVSRVYTPVGVSSVYAPKGVCSVYGPECVCNVYTPKGVGSVIKQWRSFCLLGLLKLIFHCLVEFFVNQNMV